MSSRALSLATVLFLIGFGASDAVLAQATNLEAGKAPSQIFAQTCNACHKSPRGLLKTVPPGSLPGFLRQHYTTSPDMAGVLASYLVSNGATDARYQSKDGGKDKKDGAKEKDANTNPGQSPEHQGRRQRQEAAKPEGEGAATSAPLRAARSARRGRAKNEEEAKEKGTKEGVKPEAATEQPSEGRKGKRMSKRGKPETDDAAALKTSPRLNLKQSPRLNLRPNQRARAPRSIPRPSLIVRSPTTPSPRRNPRKPSLIAPRSSRAPARHRLCARIGAAGDACCAGGCQAG